MQIEKVEISKLNAAAYNPRVDLRPGDTEYEKLKQSITSFGYVDPIIWNRRTGNVVGGHQRLKILKEMGVSDVECSVVDLSESDEMGLNLALNKISGEWDQEKLADLINTLSNMEYDMNLTGFDYDEVTDILERFSASVAESDGFDFDTAVDEVDVPVTQPGDLWILGRHRLVCGDSSIENILNIALEKDRIDMLLTDPPYNVDYSGGGNGKREKLLNDNMKSDAYADLMERVFRNISTKMKPGAAFYVWHADKERESIEKALKMAQLPVKQSLIWKKNHFVLGRQDYQWIHEPCLYGWKEGAAHYFTQDRTQSTVVCESTDFSKMTKQELLEKCNELQHVIHQFSSVIDVDKPIISSEHPTMKPVELFGKFIANSARIGEIVFDAFAGSGTTIIASEQLGRKACCIELSQTYCDVIVKRYKQFTGNDDVKLIRNGKEIMNFEIA